MTELPGFECSGDGEHDYLWIEKRGANTDWVAGQLARHAGIRRADVGFAGMKDRHAVTLQWFSVRRPGAAGTDWQSLALDGVAILDVQRHRRKLRRGAHRGNRFDIVVRECAGEPAHAAARLANIARAGVPNYFGEQRFGRDGNNIALAEKLFGGGRLSRGQRSIALSAARAWLFNHILAARVADGSWNRLLSGDTACLDGSNSIFDVHEVDEELARRCDELDLHPGGALWGRGQPGSHGAVQALEIATVEPFAVLRDGLEREAAQARRALRMAVHALDWDVADDSIRITFELGTGGFATTALREVVETHI